MSYENAPATKLLATHCACCARPLVDAVSVEAGVGPDCRKSHGYNEAQAEPDWDAVKALLVSLFPTHPEFSLEGLDASEASWRLGGLHTRALANKLVYLLARQASGLDFDRDFTAQLVNAIAALGYKKLSARLVKRLAVVVIAEEAGRLTVDTPWSPQAVETFRKISGRKWDPEAKLNTFPVSARRDVFNALRKTFPEQIAIGPKGLFLIPAVA
jgi:hypothetical protein